MCIPNPTEFLKITSPFFFYLFTIFNGWKSHIIELVIINCWLAYSFVQRAFSYFDGEGGRKRGIDCLEDIKLIKIVLNIKRRLKLFFLP